MKGKLLVILIAVIFIAAFFGISTRLGGPLVYFIVFGLAMLINKARTRGKSSGAPKSAQGSPGEIIITAQSVKPENSPDASDKLMCTPQVGSQKPEFCHNEHYSDASRLSEEEKRSERAELKSLLEQGFMDKDEYNEKLTHLR